MSLTIVIRRYTAAAYFALAFGIAWGGILLIVAPTGIPGRAADVAHLVPLVFLAMIAGPSISSLAMTGLVDGTAGYRDLVARLGRWRVGLRWYAALLIAPLLLLAILGALSLASPAFLPGIVTTQDKVALVAFALVAGLGAGTFEELGWSGFAAPRLLARHGYLAAALLIGIPWAIWHSFADYWGGAGYGALYLPHILLWVVALPAYRVLILWVYDHTGSLPLAMLMHASFTGSQGVLGPSPMVPGNDVLWYAIFAVSLWVVVGVVAATEARRRSHRPSRPRPIPTYVH
jgi:membrane protease YdiL (CAAX protease family)